MTSNNTSVIVRPMPTRKKPDLSHDEVIALLKADDPEFADLWNRSTPARVVSGELVGYRYDHDLTQAELAKLVGVKQPQIARWESGDSLPSPANLTRLAGTLGLEFVFSYAPADRRPKHITKSTLEDAEAYEEHGATVRVAASSQPRG
jgi:transcriptional regulator with XRE-family HTH domain